MVTWLSVEKAHFWAALRGRGSSLLLSAFVRKLPVLDCSALVVESLLRHLCLLLAAQHCPETFLSIFSCSTLSHWKKRISVCGHPPQIYLYIHQHTYRLPFSDATRAALAPDARHLSGSVWRAESSAVLQDSLTPA